MGESIRRARTVRVSLAAEVSRPAGRGQYWQATVGQHTASGVSENDAAGTLASTLADYLMTWEPPIIVTFRGYVAISWRCPDGGWTQRIVQPIGTEPSWTGTHYDSAAHARADARHDLAHYSTDWHDDASVTEAAAFVAGDERYASHYGATELRRYAAWQRAARHAMAEGRADWHEWASRNAHTFALAEA